jgi:hypothetical protein
VEPMGGLALCVDRDISFLQPVSLNMWGTDPTLCSSPSLVGLVGLSRLDKGLTNAFEGDSVSC